MVKKNMCALDRAIRVLFSLVCIYFGFIDTSIINEPLLAMIIGGFGIFNFAVIFIGICPVYHLAGISTHKEIKK